MRYKNDLDRPSIFLYLPIIFAVAAGIALYFLHASGKLDLFGSDNDDVPVAVITPVNGELPEYQIFLWDSAQPWKIDRIGISGSEESSAEKDSSIETANFLLENFMLILSEKDVFSGYKYNLRAVHYDFDQTAYVDLAQEYRENFYGGIMEETAYLSSIVLTLAENIEQIKKVQFLVNGNPADTLDGHCDISRPWGLEQVRKFIKPDAF